MAAKPVDVDDRRDPDRQGPRIDGRRASDPVLTTRDCADRLGVSTKFIIGEIRDGRLEALVVERGTYKALYRISQEALDAYLQRYQWSVHRQKAPDAAGGAESPHGPVDPHATRD